jgi:hypothetical protein
VGTNSPACGRLLDLVDLCFTHPGKDIGGQCQNDVGLFQRLDHDPYRLAFGQAQFLNRRRAEDALFVDCFNGLDARVITSSYGSGASG